MDDVIYEVPEFPNVTNSVNRGTLWEQAGCPRRPVRLVALRTRI